MNVHISYKVHKTPDIEKDINHLIEKLRKRLQVFRPELVHLKGLIAQNSPREGFTVSFNLRLPSGQMAVQESSSTASAAVKAALDDLLQQISRHKDLLRSSHKWTRRGATNGRSELHIPFEESIAAVPPGTVSAEDVRSYVNANLGRLERFVERELSFREAAQDMPPESVTKEEVVDEAVAQALGDGSQKPDRLAIEPWLYRLAIRAIDDLISKAGEGLGDVHLEESARRQNVRASDEAELQFHQPDETLTEEAVVADERTATPEDIAYSDEMISLVQFALAGARRSDREAFILNAIEGFSVDEISAITDRRPEVVQLSIAAARELLRRSPPLASRVKPLRPTGTD
jgi:DNA-directed RNA polymerase specialized sigma24 family protein/ribosome-associated translation inhibitor RaiA